MTVASGCEGVVEESDDLYEATREVGLPDDVDDENAAFFSVLRCFKHLSQNVFTFG